MLDNGVQVYVCSGHEIKTKTLHFNLRIGVPQPLNFILPLRSLIFFGKTNSFTIKINKSDRLLKTINRIQYTRFRGQFPKFCKFVGIYSFFNDTLTAAMHN